ncbi:VOC family protein [Bacillus haynesii]|uniref:VOC family protein n=1 Tax=Bacillus haynesii TaxID=1925021 RepID=UPI00227FA774|nr:VOC family protein [Bacillus haynesii]MCY7914340.1 VOC family protein [Bacillus haynesii]MCY7924474.1 VOC family protein [Bacillus haynesii]MCY8074081.1 VOC family protein [Bacillus haynesii]MCY8771446.1 VOC family protein [Bacillus haynesii]MEC0788916.1 VOC family protein [Bacillus haynesii]
MKAKVCMVSIKVTDINEAKKFYCEKMNFNLEKEYGENIIELNVNGFPIILEKASKPNTLKYGENSQVVLGLQTDDLNKDLDLLKKNGVKVLYEEPQKCPPGHYTVIVDPFGNKIELLEFSKSMA